VRVGQPQEGHVGGETARHEQRVHLGGRGVAQARDFAGRRAEQLDRNLRPPEIARHVVHDVAQAALGDEAYVAQVELQRLVA